MHRARLGVRALEAQDDHDDAAETIQDAKSDDDAESEDTVPCVVKMKLAAFCPNPNIRKKIASITLDMNRAVGEAYAFANLHVIRLLHQRKELPKIDRNFYYRCLVAVTDSKVRSDTLNNDFKASIAAFDEQRPAGQCKVKLDGCNQMKADFSIAMATMASNHLWMNLEARIIKYLAVCYPRMTKSARRRVATAVVKAPRADIGEIIAPLPANAAAAAVAKVEEARRVALELRQIMPLPSSLQCASRAHLTLPLYFKMLQGIEELGTDDEASAVKRAKFKLLPTKAGYTLSYVPVSNQMFMGLLKTLKLENFKGDGRDEDALALWRKHCATGLVETRDRLFGCRIATDGVSASVLMAKKTTVDPSSKTIWDDSPEMLLDLMALPDTAVGGLDPGFTDVATMTLRGREDAPTTISSSWYYEKALYKLSARRTARWNAETAEATAVPPCDTCNGELYLHFLGMYLSVLPELLQHRAAKGYRNMRFLRYVHKQKALDEMVEMLAPASGALILGFGNWDGGAKSPVSRKTCGPLKELKQRLRNHPRVRFLNVNEAYTSQRCSCCHGRLTNMVATTVRKIRGVWSVRRSRVHKVLHCKTSDGSGLLGRCCGASFDRDVNASRNILMLTLCLLYGAPRPRAFLRPVH